MRIMPGIRIRAQKKKKKSMAGCIIAIDDVPFQLVLKVATFHLNLYSRSRIL